MDKQNQDLLKLYGINTKKRFVNREKQIRAENVVNELQLGFDEVVENKKYYRENLEKETALNKGILEVEPYNLEVMSIFII